jgi:hypothetical protein
LAVKPIFPPPGFSIHPVTCTAPPSGEGAAEPVIVMLAPIDQVKGAFGTGVRMVISGAKAIGVLQRLS